MDAKPAAEDAWEMRVDEVTELRQEVEQLRSELTLLRQELAAPWRPAGPLRRLAASEPEKFAAWYADYPRRVSRMDAAKAFRQVVSGGDVQTLLQNTELWIKRWAAEDRELQHIPYPASYLRAGTWREPPPDE